MRGAESKKDLRPGFQSLFSRRILLVAGSLGGLTKFYRNDSYRDLEFRPASCHDGHDVMNDTCRSE